MAHSETIKRTFALPCGYTATFCWAEQKGFGVEWTPDVPHIHSTRQQRKFREAYNIARRSFYTEVAAVLGSGVLVVDTDGNMETIMPPTKQ